MITGKYWITPTGLIDVTTSEHALYAKNYILRLLGTKGEIELSRDLFSPLTVDEAARHEKRGVPKPVLEFLQSTDPDGRTDARVYAIRELGWVRVRQNDFYVWRLTGTSLDKIRRCDGLWNGQECSPDEFITIWEIATCACFAFPLRLVRDRHIKSSAIKARFGRIVPVAF